MNRIPGGHGLTFCLLLFRFMFCHVEKPCLMWTTGPKDTYSIHTLSSESCQTPNSFHATASDMQDAYRILNNPKPVNPRYIISISFPQQIQISASIRISATNPGISRKSNAWTSSASYDGIGKSKPISLHANAFHLQ